VLFKQKKGAYFFILDVLLGVFIFVITIVLLSTFHSSTPSMIGVGQIMDNVYQEIFLTPLSAIGTSNPAIQELYDIPFCITDTSITIDQLILILRSHCNLDETEALQTTHHILSNATNWVPEQYGLWVLIWDITIFTFQQDEMPTLYQRNSTLTEISQSSTGVSRYKISALSPSIHQLPKPSEAISSFEVVIWQ
jgi:hypothetical protein